MAAFFLGVMGADDFGLDGPMVPVFDNGLAHNGLARHGPRPNQFHPHSYGYRLTNKERMHKTKRQSPGKKPEFTQIYLQQQGRHDVAHQAGGKRKRDVESSDNIDILSHKKAKHLPRLELATESTELQPKSKGMPILPVEILEHIFEYVLDEWDTSFRSTIRLDNTLIQPSDEHPPFSIMPLLIASKQSHDILLPKLWSVVTINSRNVRAFCRNVPSEKYKMVASLVVEQDPSAEYARNRTIEKELKGLRFRFQMERESREHGQKQKQPQPQPEGKQARGRAAEAKPRGRRLRTSHNPSKKHHRHRSKTRTKTTKHCKPSHDFHDPVALPGVTHFYIRTICQKSFGRIPEVALRSRYDSTSAVFGIINPTHIIFEIEVKDSRFITQAFQPAIKSFHDFYFLQPFKAITHMTTRCECYRNPTSRLELDIDAWDLYDNTKDLTKVVPPKQLERSNAAFHAYDDYAAKEILNMVQIFRVKIQTIKMRNFSDHFKEQLAKRFDALLDVKNTCTLAMMEGCEMDMILTVNDPRETT